MPKQELEGTLDEQLAAAYEMVQERMAEGKFTGAEHYAKEIIKVDPNYRDIQEILKQARQAKREQQLTLIISLVGAVIAIAITRWLGWTKDWQSLIFAFIGLVLGFLFSTFVVNRRTS